MARILTTLILASLLGLTACTVYGKKPVKALADATGGETLEKALWHDMQEKDWKDLELHTASNFVFVSPHGKLDRQAALDEFRKMELKEYSIGDLSTEINGAMFVVTYTIAMRGTKDGQALPSSPQRCLSVWQQQKSGWMWISHVVVGGEGAASAPGTAH
jgi:hypothetical protein